MKATATVLSLVLVASLASGCATFVGRKHVNLAPFAENAVSVAADIEYGLVRTRTVYDRPYVDGPAVAHYTSQWGGVRTMLRGIVAYAVEVVTISQSHMSEPEQAHALATYVNGLGRPIIEARVHDLHFTPHQFDSLVTRIGTQKKYLSALNAAQPIVDEVARVAADTLEALKGSLESAREEVSNRIHTEHVGMLGYNDYLRETQTRTLRSLMLLTYARRGTLAAIDSMLTEDPALSDFLKDPEHPSRADFKALEDRLLARLTMFKSIREQLVPEMDQQDREMRELDDLVLEGRTSIVKATGAVEIWRRSHQTMAAGITDPAAIDLFGIAKQAVKKVSPLP